MWTGLSMHIITFISFSSSPIRHPHMSEEEIRKKRRGDDPKKRDLGTCIHTHKHTCMHVYVHTYTYILVAKGTSMTKTVIL